MSDANLYADQGTTFSSKITVYGGTNEPLDLTGYTAVGSVKKNYQGTPVAVFNAVVLPSGSVDISLTPAQTAVIKPGRYLYDVFVTKQDYTLKIAGGTFECLPSVTVNATQTPPSVTASSIGLGSVDNTRDLDKPVSTATQAALNLKANLNSPTFTGTVSGISAAMVGLGAVDNTRDLDKPVSTATATALATKAPAGSYVTTGGLQSSLGDAGFDVLQPVDGQVLSYTDNTWKNTDVQDLFGTSTILTKLGGATPEAGKIGEEFIPTIFETVSGAQAKADAAEADAISAASLDATSKANAALASALAADVTETTSSLLTKLAGATPEAGKIGEEFMPSVIEAEIELPINETTALPAGTITRDTKNRIRIHDGATPGGVENPREFHLRGHKNFQTGSFQSNMTLPQIVEIDKCTIPHSTVSDGFSILGNAFYSDFFNPYEWASPPEFILYLRDSQGNIVSGTSTTNKMRCPVLSSSNFYGVNRFNVFSYFQFLNSNNVLTINPDPFDGNIEIIAQDANNDNWVSTKTFFNGSSTVPFRGIGQFCYLCAGLYLYPRTSGTNAPIITFSCDLRVLL